MNAALAKLLGWGQFLFTAVLPAIASGQLPHGATGWLAFVGTLATAAGVHAAASTDGAK